MLVDRVEMFPGLGRVKKQETPQPQDISINFDTQAAAKIFQQLQSGDRPQINFSPVCPDFRAWYHNTGELVRLGCAAVIINSGKAEDELGAYKYLNDCLATTPQRRPVPSVVADYEGTRKSQLKPQIRLLLDEARSDQGTITAWRYGTMGHAAVSELVRGNLADLFNPFAKMDMAQMAEFVEKSAELAIGNYPRIGEIRFLNRMLKQSLDRNFGALQARDRKYVARLYDLLKPVYGNHLDLLGEMPPVGLQNYGLTLMCWSSAIEYGLNHPNLVLFPEVPILPYEQDYSGGRPDAIEVVSVNGRPLTEPETRMVRRFAESNPDSGQEIVACLIKVFGPDIKLKPIDWKMGIGDGSPSWRPIDPNKTPLSKNVEQMRRYITFGTLAYILGKAGNFDDGWTSTEAFTRGEIVYFLPGLKPLVCAIPFSLQEQEIYLREQLAKRHSRTRLNARVRDIDGRVKAHILNLSGGKPVRIIPVREVAPNYTLSMPLGEGRQPIRTVSQLLERYKEYQDPNRVLENLNRKDGKGIYSVLHLDRLIEAIKARKIAARGFNLRRGGFVPCLFADHDDSTASMNVQIEKGFAHCHGISCGRTVYFAEGSVPDELDSNIKISNIGPGYRLKDNEVVVPDEHRKVTESAQEILQRLLRGNREMERYIASRGVDLDLAREFGVGAGSMQFLSEMLDVGFTFDQIKKAGFIGYAQRADVRGGLCFEDRGRNVQLKGFLASHGLRVDDVLKVTKVNDDFSYPEYPYFILQDRITFPLDWGCFYGRSTWSDRPGDKHRKTLIGDSQVPQGAFGIHKLSLNCEYVVVSEGVFDALSFYQLGFPSGAVHISLVGTHNELIMQKEVKSKPKKIGFGLDNDKGGIQATLKHIEWLRQLGYEGPIVNTTEEFIDEYPGARNYDDPNSYLRALAHGEIA